MNMTESQSKVPSVTSEEFRDVIGRFATGVTVVTTSEEDRWFGTTASAVSSLSLEPPMLLVCMNRASETGSAIARVGSFAVNILDESQDHLARRFASKGADKFKEVAVTPGLHGEPLIERALAHLECRVTEKVLGGTHLVFLGEVEHASGRVGAPLAYFRGEFGRLHLSQDEQAHSTLRAGILDRSIEIGEPLDVAALAERLGTPQRSAQQALMRLVDEGLVRQEPDGSFVVVPLSFQVVEDALRGRLLVQLGVAVETVGRMSAEQLQELRRCMEATYPVRADGELMSPDEWFDANMTFHEHMISAAGSEALIDAHRRLTVPGLMTRAVGPEDTVSEDMASAHVAIVEGYEAGDLGAVCEAVRHDFERAIDFNRQRMRRAGGLV